MSESDRDTEALYERAIGEWGPAAQIDKLTEEAAELAAVCARRQNGLAADGELAREAADVEIMLEQLRQLIGDEPIEAARDAALDELERRLDAADAEKAVTDGGQPAETTSSEDDDVDVEGELLDTLEELRLLAIRLDAREDVVLAYYASQAVESLEQAATTIQQREATEGRPQGGDAA